MRELEYPFDAGLLISKKKSLKKKLLADGSIRLKKKIAVLGGSTTGDIIKQMELFLLNFGIEPTFYESEYAQYWQDAMFPGQELLDFHPDLIFIHTTNRNITSWPQLTDSREQVEEILHAEYSRFETMWEHLHDTFHCPIVQNNFEMPFYRVLGSRDSYDYRGRRNFITRLNQKFYEYAMAHDDFHIHDLEYVAADFGLRQWANPEYWNMYKYAMCFDAIPYVGFSVAKIIKSVFGRNKKVLALDLDNTLWGGVVGDDGVDGIEIGQENGFSQSYHEFQSYLKQVQAAGVMLTVCSKNDHENAIAGLNHLEGVLRPADFIIIKANWENKDRNLLETASELNVLPDSIVFADDNPAERAIVLGQIPGIAVPEMDSVENYIINIDRNGYFEATTFNEDDLKRNDMYKENVKRAAQMAAFADYDEYLKSLEMTAIIDDFIPMYLARITQLTNKSNQFNVTTKRYTTAQMEEVAGSGEYIRLYGKLFDKFGDNGVVSVVIGKKNDKVLNIDLWLMSCRVLKRTMEQAMLDRLVEKAKAAGIETIRGYYYPTAKNKMVKELFGTFGFTKIREDEEGNTVWELNLDHYENQCKAIEIRGNEAIETAE